MAECERGSDQSDRRIKRRVRRSRCPSVCMPSRGKRTNLRVTRMLNELMSLMFSFFFFFFVNSIICKHDLLMEHIRHKHTHKTCAHYTYTYQISRLGYNISDEFQNRTECLGESRQEGGSTRKRMKVRMRERKKGEKKMRE